MRLKLARVGEDFHLHHRASVRPGDLTQAIFDTKPAIIHFSGHGSPAGELLLENDAGQIHPVEPEALEALFALFKDDVRCVLLNSCYSYKQAMAISRYIDNVIGMRHSIGDEAAIAFSVGFYKALGSGRPVHECFEFGRTELRLYNIPEYQTPVLLRRPKIAHTFLPERDYIIQLSERSSAIRFSSEYNLFAKLFLEGGSKQGCILIDPDSYDNIGNIFDDIYTHYLQDQVPILSYGDSWVMLISDACGGEQLIVPWEWLSKRNPAGQLAQWISLRKLGPADIALNRGCHGKISLTRQALSRDSYIILAANNPMILSIASDGPKALASLLDRMLAVPAESFEGGHYRYKMVIHPVLFGAGHVGFAFVDDKMLESDVIELREFFSGRRSGR